MTVVQRADTGGGFDDVLLAAAEGRPDALGMLNDRYLPALRRFAAARNAEDPDAVANQALYDGIRTIHRLQSRTEATFRSYLFTCAANRIRSEHRRGTPATVPLDPTIHGPAGGLDPAELTVGTGWLGTALDELPQDQRAVIVERFAKGNTIGETAASLDKTPAAVKHLQSRALARIRRYVLAAGLVTLITALALLLAIMGRNQPLRVEPVDDPGQGSDPTTGQEQHQSGIGVPRTLRAEAPSDAGSTGRAATERSVNGTGSDDEDAVWGAGAQSGAASREAPGELDDGAPPPASTAPAVQSARSGASTTTAAPTTTTSTPPTPSTPPTEAQPPTTSAAPTTSTPVSPAAGVCADTGVEVNPQYLWPNNGKFVEVVATFSFGPACDPAQAVIRLVAVEVEYGDPDLDVENADIGTDDRRVSLRAKRPREYELRWTVTGPDGVSTTVRAEVEADKPPK